MIAEIYPLLRLPSRFEYFDYLIPENLKVSTGDLVKIVFRGKKVLGLVKSTKDSSTIEKLAPIQEVVASSFFTLEDILRVESIATALVQSPASILNTALQGFKHRGGKVAIIERPSRSLTVSSTVVGEIKQTLMNLEVSDNIFSQTSPEGAITIASILSKKVAQQILVLVPRPRDAIALTGLIDLGDAVAILHGQMSEVERDSVIAHWQSGKIKTLIGTKQASLLPANKIDAIVVINTESEDHWSWDRNPRYDARLAVELLARQHRAKIVFSAPLPRVSDLANKEREILWSVRPSCQVASLKAQEQRSTIPFVTESLNRAIADTLQKGQSVLLSYNRKGFAGRLQCNNCGHIPFCGTCGNVPFVRQNDLKCAVCQTEMWIPVNCPSCKRATLNEKGIGNKRMQAELQKAFPGIDVVVIEKSDEQPVPPKQPTIVLATEYYFRQVHTPFLKSTYGLIAELAFDLHLAHPHFDASEVAAERLHRLLRITEQQHAQCIIQTWLPEQVQSMLKPKKFLADELAIRKTYNLPPAMNRLTIKPSVAQPIVDLLNLKHNVQAEQMDDSTIIRYAMDQGGVVADVLKTLPPKFIIVPEIISYHTK
ncbi:MAG: hypothetical protein ABIA47_02030 [bacterium]